MQVPIFKLKHKQEWDINLNKIAQTKEIALCTTSHYTQSNKATLFRSCVACFKIRKWTQDLGGGIYCMSTMVSLWIFVKNQAKSCFIERHGVFPWIIVNNRSKSCFRGIPMDICKKMDQNLAFSYLRNECGICSAFLSNTLFQRNLYTKALYDPPVIT